MAIDDTGGSEEQAASGVDVGGDSGAAVGEYSWSDFRREEHGEGRFDRTEYLGFDPRDLPRKLEAGASAGKTLSEVFEEFRDPESTPVAKGAYFWEHFKQEYYYNADGRAPRNSEGEKEPFDAEQYLGFAPAETEERLSHAESIATDLENLVDDRTVNVAEELDEDAFFSDRNGNTTVSNRYDLEKSVPLEKKTHFVEENRYWVNKPYAYVIIFHSRKENERKYYVIEPHLNEIENELKDFLSRKLKTAIKYSEDDVIVQGSEADRAQVIQREAERLLQRYGLYDGKITGDVGSGDSEGMMGSLKGMLGMNGSEPEPEETGIEGIEVRPEPLVLEEDPDTLTEYQVEKLLYVLKRNFIGYAKIDPVKHDINVEDISCDGYNSRVFVYHTDYEQIISNVEHGKESLDDFVVKLAQRSGKGISKRQPQVDATLPDGSRAQLTLGREVSDHGTNYTIRQFKDVPFTPIDLINWNTFNLDEMAFLWLCIENHKSLIFAGGTASGKTTSLNAVSLFIPSNTKIVSIEDTREVELPQRNWVASVTRPSFGQDEAGDVDEFDLLEAALRQRPDYIVMGEVRGEEGRTLFQVMSTGHTTYTTFHADSVDEVLKRFTTDPINVSKTLFTALDLVAVQTQTRVDGTKVRRNKTITEITDYDSENDEISVQDIFKWEPERDSFRQLGASETLQEIAFDRGWSDERLEAELFKRRTVLAYLIQNGLNDYAEVAATIQAFIKDPETVLTLIANDRLESQLTHLKEMESVLIDVDEHNEEIVPRPEPSADVRARTDDILSRAEETLLSQFRGRKPSSLVTTLSKVGDDGEVVVAPDDRPPALEPGTESEEASKPTGGEDEPRD